MQVVGQDDGGDDRVRNARSRRSPRVAQRIDSADQQIAPAITQRDGEEVRRACNPIAAISDHAPSVAAKARVRFAYPGYVDIKGNRDADT